MHIAKVDSTEAKVISEQYEIKGFPTLYWFVNGERQEYTGGRTTDAIVSWIAKKSGPPAEELTCEGVTQNTADAKLTSVYFGEKHGDIYDAFIKLAGQKDDMMFFEAPAECAAAHGASAPGVSIFRSFDESPVHHTAGELADFVEDSSLPSLIEFSEDYIEPIFGKGREALIFFSNEKDSALHAKYAEISKDLKGEILFVQSGTSDGIQQRLAEFVGMDASTVPAIRLLSPGEEMLKFAYELPLADMTSESIKTFISDIHDGKVKPHLKSEPIPENAGPLTTLVGDNWADIVMDTSKDVLVKYYAPWCGHCKKLAPIWEELAEAVADIPDLVIADFDATLNEIEGLSIRGYPTLKWYPKDDKSGRDFEGGRELPDFVAYLAENSSAYQAKKGMTSDEL